jgi:hypothetical protein
MGTWLRDEEADIARKPTSRCQAAAEVLIRLPAWLADLVSSGAACGSNPNRDPKYVAAGTASAAATTSKLAFVAIWNPMAPRYGQQTYTATGF